MCDDDVIEWRVRPPEPGKSDFDDHCCVGTSILTSNSGAMVQAGKGCCAPELLGGDQALYLDVGERQSGAPGLSHLDRRAHPCACSNDTPVVMSVQNQSRHLGSLTMTTPSASRDISVVFVLIHDYGGSRIPML